MRISSRKGLVQPRLRPSSLARVAWLSNSRRPPASNSYRQSRDLLEHSASINACRSFAPSMVPARAKLVRSWTREGFEFVVSVGDANAREHTFTRALNTGKTPRSMAYLAAPFGSSSRLRANSVALARATVTSKALCRERLHPASRRLSFARRHRGGFRDHSTECRSVWKESNRGEISRGCPFNC